MCCCIACLGCTDCSGMCACLPALCCWRWVVWCVRVTCVDSDVHSCFELWSALSQSSWIRRYISITSSSSSSSSSSYYYYLCLQTGFSWTNCIIIHRQKRDQLMQTITCIVYLSSRLWKRFVAYLHCRTTAVEKCFGNTKDCLHSFRSENNNKNMIKKRRRKKA